MLFIDACEQKTTYYHNLLDEFESNLNKEKENLWSILEKGSDQFIHSKRDTASINSILQACLIANKLAKVATLVNNKGIIIKTFPDKYSFVEGSDINYQPHVKYIADNRFRFISRKFLCVQGFMAFAFILPMIDRDEYLGTLNILVDPDELIHNALSKVDIPRKSKIIIFQSNGTVLFSDYKQFEDGNIEMHPDYNDNLASTLMTTLGSRASGDTNILYTNENKKIKLFWKQIMMEKDKWVIALINEI